MWLYPVGTSRSFSERRIEIVRGEWRTTVDAYAEMTCDAENFYVVTRLSARSGDDEVFARAWDHQFRRDHI